VTRSPGRKRKQPLDKLKENFKRTHWIFVGGGLALEEAIEYGMYEYVNTLTVWHRSFTFKF
jgi:hypothetical protein